MLLNSGGRSAVDRGRRLSPWYDNKDYYIDKDSNKQKYEEQKTINDVRYRPPFNDRPFPGEQRACAMTTGSCFVLASDDVIAGIKLYFLYELVACWVDFRRKSSTSP